MNDYTLTDTFLFVNNVTSITNGNNYCMASFDIISLFTNIPLDETIGIIINTFS